MMKIAMSPAAAAVLRGLIGRAKVDRNRILLTDVESIDWRSLTFTGERHQISLRITAADSAEVVQRMCAGLADAEFSIPGLIVADIGVLGTPQRKFGCTELVIEALTISED
jgi:hypothetical protein